ncbi:MAG: hypothetical protein AB1791_04200 [Chloroflexota bacterium]
MTIRQGIETSLEVLPEETLSEVIAFLEYLQYRQSRQAQQQSPYKPVALGGLWAGVTIGDEDIAQVRQEMWSGFGELDTGGRSCTCYLVRVIPCENR